MTTTTLLILGWLLCAAVSTAIMLRAEAREKNRITLGDLLLWSLLGLACGPVGIVSAMIVGGPPEIGEIVLWRRKEGGK